MTARKLIIPSDKIYQAKRVAHAVASENSSLSAKKNRLRKSGKPDLHRYSRRACFLVTDYVIEKRVYRDFVCNLSLSGALINTRNRFPVGQKLVFVLNLVGGGIFKTTASIARAAAIGVAIKFDLLLAAGHRETLFRQLLEGNICNTEACNA